MAAAVACSVTEGDPVPFSDPASVDSVRISPGSIQFQPADGNRDTLLQFAVQAWTTGSLTGVMASARSVRKDSIITFPKNLTKQPDGSWRLTLPVRVRTTANETLELEVVPVRTGYGPISAYKIRREVRANPGTAPVFGDITFPDTVRKPVNGTINVRFTARVTDADGLSNIERVEFFIYELNNNPVGGSQQLLDDGLSTSGDLVAGDGIFSRTFQIASTNTSRTLSLKFNATDRAGLKAVEQVRQFTIADPL